MRLTRLTGCAAILAAHLLFAPAPASARSHHPVGLILHDNVPLRSAPRVSALALTELLQQTQVVVMGRRGVWDNVVIWASVRGWVPHKEVVFRRPWHVASSYRAPEAHYHVQSHGPFRIRVRALVLAPLGLVPRPGAAALSHLSGGRTVMVSAWQQDGAGRLWYRVGRLWAAGDGLQFRWPSPPGRGEPTTAAARVTGKGMWITLGPVAQSAPDVVLDACARTGLTHLYVEAAISPLGFHGRSAVGPLIDAAHRRHVSVVAWVYPYLYDIASDVHLTRTVAGFRTAAGNSFDGIAVDLERNVTLSGVRGYSQLVREYLGPRYLLVGVTYPPQSSPRYPFQEVGHDYDVLAPMDYWHETRTSRGLDYGQMPYGRDYGYRYARDSIEGIRALGVQTPLAPIGQVFDDFGRMELGPYAPSDAEIRGFLQGSKAGGAIGVSFFQWMTATVPEWRAIRAFRF